MNARTVRRVTVGATREATLASMRARVQRRTNRLFVWLFGLQWGLAVILTIMNPRGAAVLALTASTIVSFLAIGVIKLRPECVVTRHVAAYTEMFCLGLLTTVLAGRIDASLFAFGALALIGFYRDWRIIGFAALVAILTRLAFDSASSTVLEFIPAIALETVVVILGCRRNAHDTEDAAIREATLEATAATIQRKVENRTRQLAEHSERYRALVETTAAMPFEYDAVARRVLYVAPQLAGLIDCSVVDLRDEGFFAAATHAEDRPRVAAAIDNFAKGLRSANEPVDFRLTTKHGRIVHVRAFFSTVIGSRVRGVTLDVTRQTLLEAELRNARKLESVGRLAAGIAHEINTPIQYVTDSLQFTRDVVGDLMDVVEAQRSSLNDPVSSALRERAIGAADRADLDFVRAELPRAIDRAVEGATRVAKIVRSMKAFAHPDQSSVTPCDLGEAIETTLAIASCEYKHVADVALQFESLPAVRCFVGEINQAILNVVVNAAHAIGDVVAATGKRGTITVQLRQDGNDAVISIADTGTGIPEHARNNIFDQFFTTKDVGKGTGQGLALVHAIIVEKHRGSISFDTALGIGTTFHIRIPIEPDKASQRLAS